MLQWNSFRNSLRRFNPCIVLPVEIYIGINGAMKVGALISGGKFQRTKLRPAFFQAKENCPCIVLVDEIDAVGSQRGMGIGGGIDERDQTLNQLLTEMDGFEGNTGIIVVAATNRADILDSALLRPGRFDRQVVLISAKMEQICAHALFKAIFLQHRS